MQLLNGRQAQGCTQTPPSYGQCWAMALPRRAGDLLRLCQLLFERTDRSLQLVDLICEPVLDLRSGEGEGGSSYQG